MPDLDQQIREANHKAECVINRKVVGCALGDLFQKEPSKIDQLRAFMKKEQRFLKSTIDRWGVDHYYTSAVRRAQEMADRGEIYQMREDIKRIVFPKSKERAWSVYESDKEIC